MAYDNGYEKAQELDYIASRKKDYDDDDNSLMIQDARKRDSIIRGLANDIIGAAGQTADYNAEMLDFSVSFRSAGTMITAKYRKSVYLKTR